MTREASIMRRLAWAEERGQILGHQRVSPHTWLVTHESGISKVLSDEGIEGALWVLESMTGT